MLKTFTWKSNWLHGHAEIFEQQQLIGTMTSKGWRGNMDISFDHRSYRFINRGFWKVKTMVYDSQLEELLFTINYGGWNNKALITKSNGETYEGKATGFWRKTFTLKNDTVEIVYSPSSRHGSLTSNTTDKLLIFCGLFIIQTYNKMAAAAVA